MTRINCIPVEELVDKHLVAEYRELPRVYALVKLWHERAIESVDSLPSEYTLGKGHVKFFYNKLGYIRARHWLLVFEMQNRGFVTNFTPSREQMRGIPPTLHNMWIPTPEAVVLNRHRIAERLGHPA